MNKITPSLAALAMGYGAVAGLISILTFKGMTALQHLIWHTGDSLSGGHSSLQIFVTIMLGGALLILIARIAPSENLENLLKQSEDPGKLPRRTILTTALAAIVAVAFGGAIGPEAGIVAVVTQCSVIVSHRIGTDVAMQRTIAQAGNAGALAGFYGSPPGAAAIDGDELGSRKPLQLLAGFAGFFVFIGVARLTSDGSSSHISLPFESNAASWWLLGVAVLASVFGLVFRQLHHALEHLTSRISSQWLVIAAGTTLFALLATALPLVRFSGHHEFDELVELFSAGSWGALLLVGLAKLVAMCLCLVSGWRGGEFFPLVFIGAAVGAALAALIPNLDAGAAMATGMAASTAVGWQRPLAVFLILILLVDGPVALPLLVGVGIAYLVNMFLKKGDPVPADKEGSVSNKQA